MPLLHGFLRRADHPNSHPAVRNRREEGHVDPLREVAHKRRDRWGVATGGRDAGVLEHGDIYTVGDQQGLDAAVAQTVCEDLADRHDRVGLLRQPLGEPVESARGKPVSLAPRDIVVLDVQDPVSLPSTAEERLQVRDHQGMQLLGSELPHPGADPRLTAVRAST